MGGNAAASRYLEKDTAATHKTKFLAHVSGFITYFCLAWGQCPLLLSDHTFMFMVIWHHR